MIKRILLLGLIGVTVHLFGQVAHSELLYYPPGYDAYEGGDVQFYKDFHQILMDKNLKPCENKNEIYLIKVIVDENATIKYLRDDSNIEMADKNKCTYNLGLEVLKDMHKWKTAVIDGEKKPRVTSFYIIPNSLFENYKEGYFPDNINSMALFEGNPSGGIMKFREEVVKKIDVSGFQWKNSFKLIINFTVNEEGNISNVQLEESSGSKDFDNRIISGIKRIKKKWTPARIDGIPISYRFKLPLSFGM